MSRRRRIDGLSRSRHLRRPCGRLAAVAAASSSDAFRRTGRGGRRRCWSLAALCREHLLLIGPPGTAKTGLIERFCRTVGARPFSYLLTRFTEPSEIFGPLDVELFQAGSYQIKTEDMLPHAEIVFLDEVFQGSSAILNTLLDADQRAALPQRRADASGPR